MRQEQREQWEAVMRRIGQANNGISVIALDGRAAAGKSTLAAALAETLQAAVIHMDDFFLPLALRAPQRLARAAIFITNGLPKRFCRGCAGDRRFVTAGLTAVPWITADGQRSRRRRSCWWRGLMRTTRFSAAMRILRFFAIFPLPGKSSGSWPATAGRAGRRSGTAGSRWRRLILRPSGSGSARTWLFEGYMNYFHNWLQFPRSLCIL